LNGKIERGYLLEDDISSVVLGWLRFFFFVKPLN